MTKDEMKNRYSAFIAEISEIMGLGNPIDILKLCKTTDLFFRPLEKRIEDLEKENAELKETLKTYNGCGDWDNDFHTCRVYLQHEELQMYADQLTKATEIIKKYLAIGVGGKITQNYLDVTKEAEQFLNSEAEK